MSDETVIRFCAPTLAALKTGSLFTTEVESEKDLCDSLRSLNVRLGGKGLRVMPLRIKNGHALVYLYRPEKLKADLMHPLAKSLLTPLGYDCGNVNAAVGQLRARLAKCDDFPHEIGLFLGYPPLDVDGFMHRHDEACYTGYWKVYGNLDEALKTFARYRRCLEIYRARAQAGKRLEELAVRHA